MKRGSRAVASQSVTIFSNSAVVMPACVTAMISTNPFSPEAASAFMSPSSTAANGCLVFHSGCIGASDLHAVEREGQLHIHRLLDPERAVIVEGRDALLDRHEVRPALRRDACDEIEDRSLGRALVPGRQRIALRLRHRGGRAERGRQHRKHRQRREQDATIDAGKSHDRFHGRIPFVGGWPRRAPRIWRARHRFKLDVYLAIAALALRFSLSRHRD